MPLRRRLRRHGKLGTRNSWRAMCERCYNPKNSGYPYYGARGIIVCDRWRGRGGYANFLADLGLRPEGTTLDRIDPAGNYEPGNVRWATGRQQFWNVRDVEKRRAQRDARRARIGKCRGLASLRFFGRLLGPKATEALVHSIREALEETFGSPRNMDPPTSLLSIEAAFSDGEFGYESAHWDGLDHLGALGRDRGSWAHLTRDVPRHEFNFEARPGWFHNKRKAA